MRSIRRAMLIPILMITVFSSLDLYFRAAVPATAAAAETPPSLAENASPTPKIQRVSNGRSHKN